MRREVELKVSRVPTQRLPPPDVEWWDAPLLANKSYTDLDDSSNLRIDTDDSLITLYVQHPIPLPAPWEGKGETVRPLMLTKKVSGVLDISTGLWLKRFVPAAQEQKKMRRQRRAADLRDKQDRQKMGLIPPDPPKSESDFPSSFGLPLGLNVYNLNSQFVSPTS